MKLSGQISREEFLEKLSGWGDIYFRMALLEKNGEWHLHSMVVDHKWPKSFHPPVTGLETKFYNYREATFVSGTCNGSQLASWIRKTVGTFTNKGRNISFNLPQFPNPLNWYNRKSNCNWHFSKLPWSYTSYHWTAASQQQDVNLYNSGLLTSDEEACVTFPDLKSALLHFLYQPLEDNSVISDPIPVMGIAFRDAHPVWIKEVRPDKRSVLVSIDGEKIKCLLEVGNPPKSKKKELESPADVTFDFNEGVPQHLFVYLLKNGELMDSYEQRPEPNMQYTPMGYTPMLLGGFLGDTQADPGTDLQKLHETEKEIAILESQDLSLLTKDTTFANFLRERWIETQKCIKAETYLAAVILMGSLLEGVLFAVVKDNQETSNRAKASPKKNGKPKPSDEWSLNDLIEVAHECGWIKKDRKAFNDILRDYRNIVHPRHQLQTMVNPDEGTTAICWEVVKATINDLITWRKQDKIHG